MCCFYLPFLKGVEFNEQLIKELKQKGSKMFHVSISCIIILKHCFKSRMGANLQTLISNNEAFISDTQIKTKAFVATSLFQCVPKLDLLQLLMSFKIHLGSQRPVLARSCAGFCGRSRRMTRTSVM